MGDRYKVYDWEEKKWPEFQKLYISRGKIKRMYLGLSKHFQIKMPKVHFIYKWQQGEADSRTKSIKLTKRKNINLGYALHEFGHHVVFCKKDKTGEKHHGKAFKNRVSQVYKAAIDFKYILRYGYNLKNTEE